MKYTRYDIKRNRRKNFSSSIIIIAILFIALLIVSILAPVIFKNKGHTNAINIENKEKNFINAENTYKYILIQCGCFQNKDKAVDLKSTISSTVGNSFIIEDAGRYRVIYGIFPEKDGNKIIKDLSDKKIENSKMTFSINKEDLCNKEVGELISANLQVLNTLYDNNIKSIPTDDLKKWTNALKEVDKNSKNYGVLQDLKNHNLKYNKELSKGNVEENYVFLYHILKEIK